MNKQLKCNGEFVTIHHKKIHIFRQGDLEKPKLVFLAGSATVAPVYDFKIANKLKLYKIPLLYPLNNRCLTKNEIIQQKLLMNRNAFNRCYINEGKELLQNVSIVSEHGTIKCPTLLFSSNGKQIDKYWVKSQQEFAELMNAKLITYDCGHYIHYYKSNEMRTSIINFVNKLKK